MAKHPPHVHRAALECGLDPDSFVLSGQIACPEHLGREGKFKRADGTTVGRHTERNGTKHEHHHGEHRVCGAPADVYLRGPDGSGKPHYHSVCTVNEQHVHEFDEAACLELMAGGVAILRRPR